MDLITGHNKALLPTEFSGHIGVASQKAASFVLALSHSAAELRRSQTIVC